MSIEKPRRGTVQDSPACPVAIDEVWNAVPSVIAWPAAPDVVPATRCHFSPDPPRHFSYPAILLLLAESPGHGYRICEELGSLGFGKADRPSVYRALSDLERDGLVVATDESPTAGPTRHVYRITGAGEQALQVWMSAMAVQRSGLDQILQRYWYATAQRVDGSRPRTGHVPVDVGIGGPDQPGEPHQPAALTGARSTPARFAVAGDRSSLTIEARSNVGPIAFTTGGLSGWLDVAVADGMVVLEPVPKAHLAVRVLDLVSGNALYDAELARRVDARRFPIVVAELRTASQLGRGNCYLVTGDLTMHGVCQQLQGMVTITVHDVARRQVAGGPAGDRHLTVTGEHVIDIRHFAMEVPAMALLRLYPDVRLHLHVEADRVS